MAWASCQVTTSLIACACASSKTSPSSLLVMVAYAKLRIDRWRERYLTEDMLAAPREPDRFLVVARQSEVGPLHIGSAGWKSDSGLIISFSYDCPNL
jgi:hypothetical protein